MVTAGLSEARQGFRPLPSVKDEIEQITRNVSGSVLVNQEFTRSNFVREMSTKRNVVHLATHGQFSSNAGIKALQEGNTPEYEGVVDGESVASET
ncbi:MAG: CHAT domain-containing protein, partial [Moorea sp. SIO3G5]|nr:CHAT domain-containing protein [Moorena sp. SIO3G5]